MLERQLEGVLTPGNTQIGVSQIVIALGPGGVGPDQSDDRGGEQDDAACGLPVKEPFEDAVALVVRPGVGVAHPHFPCSNEMMVLESAQPV